MISHFVRFLCSCKYYTLSFLFICLYLGIRNFFSFHPSEQPLTMEQITQQKTALDNTTQEQPKTVNETFNAMRTAALSMFQQRTKDLTRVSEMQQQAHDLEQEIECAQQTLSQLHTMCAKLDARVEEEERRTKERETHVKSVHTALFQLDEELKSYGRLKESTEHVGNVLHKFVHDTQSEESRFNQLLKEGMRVVGDRTPADFKNSAADLRRRTSLLKNYIHHLTSTGVVGEEFLTNLQKWSTGNWRQFPELSTVIQRSEEILQCTADEGSIQLTSDYPEVAQESLLFTVSPQDSSSETTVTDLQKQVSSLVDRYLHELDHLCALKESLAAKCNELGITTTVLEEEPLGQLRKDWSEMIAAHNEWCELHEKLQQSQAERDEADSRVALLNSDISQLQSKSAELGDEITQLQETQTVLDDQVENYATATGKALFTLHKLKTSIHNVKQSIRKVHRRV
ncbi:hypothetical protein AGDE_08973 [Angomonas deanei]|uniref:Uncharacterized protein n=1 Tax=Angomonas deanei TaxID=59799 RepID=A0A7G2CKL1_9TRYP|nr:hypothetical protein AGDE_08973 [Angomonas deanei]CAD2219935.1 hypothetical protein, conserved [Angomonas deanei]|eukprot:EPY31595.1 hypothetical protein AGDE_08973 [Angomonas deanei]